jgi:hypothetical protein
VNPREAVRLRTALLEGAIDARAVERDPERLAMRKSAEGATYDGYVWDVLRDKQLMAETEIWRRIAGASGYAMWDLHLRRRAETPRHTATDFPLGTVLAGRFSDIRRGLAFLPEDLYLFDRSLSWVAALTHEDIDGERFCLWSGSVPALARAL